MNCPYCNFHFKVFAVNARTVPETAPIICEDCGEVALLENGDIRKVSSDELTALKQSPAWRTMIGPAQNLILNQKKVRHVRNN